jgi:outer membrane protein, multidrug efflux system
MRHGFNRIGWTRAATALLLASSVGGCAGARMSPVTFPAVPAAWSTGGEGIAAGSPVDLARWWEEFGDETLASFVERALAGNVDLGTAQARLRQARAQWKVTNAGRFPSLSASGSAGVSDTSRVDSTGLFSAGLDAGWEPDVFGGLSAAVRGAAADIAASEADLYDTQVSLTAEVALNYVALRQAQARLAITRENLASQSETLQLTIWRADAGLVTGLDVAQARANRDQTGAQVPALETTIAEAQNRMAVLLGVPPGSVTAELAQSGAIPAAPDQILVGIPADTLRQRPDVRAAEQRVIAAAARTAQATAAKYPSFKLDGSLGLKSVAAAVSGGTSVLSAATASAVQTLFDAGRIRAQIEVETAAQQQAASAYESTVLAALEEVENALEAFSNSRARLAALESAADAARQAASLAGSRYEAGLTDFQSVLDTQRTVLSLEDALASSRADRTSAVIRLYKALGGGWTPTASPASTSQEGRRS